jgi:hypothetical protein
VVVIDLMQEKMALSVISQVISATVKLSAIAKIHKYSGIHEGHHFMPMAVEVHNTSGHDMDHLIRECAHLFHDK